MSPVALVCPVVSLLHHHGVQAVALLLQGQLLVHVHDPCLTIRQVSLKTCNLLIDLPAPPHQAGIQHLKLQIRHQPQHRPGQPMAPTPPLSHLSLSHQDHLVGLIIPIVIICQDVILELGPEGCSFLGFPRGIILPFCLVLFSSELYRASFGDHLSAIGEWRPRNILNQAIGNCRTQCFNLNFFNNTKRYGPLHGPTSSSCEGLWPSAEASFALGAKKKLIMLCWPILGHFWCSVVT